MASLRARISQLEYTIRPEPDLGPRWLSHSTDSELAELEAIYETSKGRDFTQVEHQRFLTIETRALKRIEADEPPNPAHDLRNTRGA